MEESQIGEIFLSGFVRELIKASKPAPEDYKIESEPRNNILEVKKKTIEMLPEFLSPVRTIETKRVGLNAGPKPRVMGMKSKGHGFIQSRRVQEQSQTPQSSEITLLQVDLNDRSTAEKLNFLIKDPAVTEIECLGSEQMLLVRKAGSVQRTKVKLSIEEVYQLIAEFSQRTRIPVIEGTFKAALNNLILTAILSETLGPRFILQKKNPFQKLVPDQ